MYKNQCMMCSINLKINSGICQVQIKYVNSCTFLFLFLIHGFIQICFGLFDFFFFLHLFYEQEILFNKINATEFPLSGIYLFSENTFFY